MDRTRTAAAAVGIAAITWAVAAPTVSSSTTHPSLNPSRITHAATAAVDPVLKGAKGSVKIVVQGSRSAEANVVQLGGKVRRDLPIIDAFSATLPADQVNRLAKVPGVTAITKDGTVQVQAAPMTNVGGTNPANVYQQITGAAQLKSAGDNGHGANVALIDTGVSSMADTSGQVMQVSTDLLGLTHASCVNLAGDGTCNDLYGHGSFVGGLIDGTGAASGGQYAGVAPGSKIVSVKIAGASGAADVSNVIAGIQWVTAFHSVYNIKVLNLSLGTNSSQSYMLSPLDYAVEQAWKAGVTVVVAASNLGPGAGTIDKPADDPFVITVGATDDNGTATLSDDSVPAFSAQGPTSADGLAKPDIAAPGVGLISLAAPGSALTTNFPPAMSAPYRQGSGTSMSTAVVSGLVADLLSAHPTWTPDRVKYALMSTAQPDASSDPTLVGAGLVNGYAALTAPSGLANQGVTPGNGLGTLQADRGTVQVQLSGLGGITIAPLQGEVTAQLLPYNPLTMLFENLTSALNGSGWYGSGWYGSGWYGSGWYGSGWYGSGWYGSGWYGSGWYGSGWYGSGWYGYWG
jgi:serine protease AprX